ncbi:LOW QUALITY PROTEIN: rotatin [Lates calcarifer]|uniref:LOW QUALITY PROTEIN: rotatin n=1 Tax=Lates calcarifer TaxID=8187 RepID=A0AAJ7PKK1_LATCA|nr:LOW QUALITY PROTEIN: rotatin [Lates calcarifer]
MELSPLIKKIGHSLVEIRVRALKSIICKLDHSLISVSDIVQEKMLFVYLLEWFNFPEVPMQEEVLELLTTLSKHPSAAQMLRDVGAVDFLTQLSPNVEPRLRAVISGTLDQLFQLPDLLPSHTTVYSHGPRNTTPTVPTVFPPEEDFPKMGYFHKSIPAHTDVPPHKIAVHESVRCLRFSVFPWLTLTNTDRHILSSNESSLRSNNPNLVRTTCDLLCDVIMQDFPPEIFLQRPSIIKNLLSLLRVGSGKGEASYLQLQALSCLRQLCAGLRRRLRFHQDPSFYSTKQDPVSQNSSFSYTQEVRGTQRSQASSPGGGECSPRPSVVGRTSQRARGDGQDGDAVSNSGSSHRGGSAVQAPGQMPQSPADVAHLELPDLGVEDVLELQLQQLTLAQFTVATMEHAIPLLKTEGSHVFHRVLELLCDAVLLLGDSVCELVWDDRSLVGMELKEKLQTFLELLGDILSYHQNYPADIPHSTQVHHRMAYMGTAIFTIKFLQTILPPEKASNNLPESTATAIFHLSLDTSLGSLLPSMQETAVAYLEQVNSDGHDLYRRVNRAALWMESTCNFLKEGQAEGEKNWLELLELADQAIDGLPFHQHLPIIKECVQICSYLWKFDQPSPLLQTESQKLLLKLLSHPLPPVKIETYTCTLNLLKECLGIQNLSRQEAGACGGVNFLIHHRVLYEISAFGLQDSAEKVNLAAKDILLFLLKGRLMMTASTWDRFNEALYPVMPILQGYAATEESLGNCVLLISDMLDTARDNVLPRTAKLKAALRLLFTKQPTVRIAAVQQILPHLTSPDEAKTARPDLDQVAITTLPNLYCLRNPLDISLDTSNKSVLKVESVEKLFCILSSDTVDISLRRSAAEQLSVVLQDTTMHPVLKNLGITDKVISFIMESVNGNKSMDCLLEPCVCILRKLVYADPSLRHSLAQRNLLLLTLLRASLILKENKSSGNDIAVLMSLLLFDEIASIEIWSDKSSTDVTLAPFSLPLTVIRRYNIPFQVASHHAVSPYCCILPPSSELLTLAPARQALQVAWNTAWHSGIDNLLEELRGNSTRVAEFHPDLKLPEAQVLSLQVVHLPMALQDCIQAIITAAGHSSVTSALSKLSLYLLIDRLAVPHIPTHSCRDTLHSLNWQAAIARFLQVRPACVEDERLLVGIVAFLNAYFRQMHSGSASDPEDRDLRWILELLLNQDTVSLLKLLLVVETQTSAQSPVEPEELKNHVSQRLQRELTSFFNTLLLRLTRTTDSLCLALAGPFKSQLAVCLLQSLRVSDAPRFYGLPSLERTLQGMVSLTAQPGWSSHCPDLEPISLCSKYLSGLLEVISSFYVEWGGNSMSFMGKGVTKNAVICLLHLSHEMLAENKDKNFISQWSLGNEAAAEETSGSQLGLAWLIPLWVDRDQEVRFASLGLGGALSSVPSGCHALCASCQNISGGLWGTLLNILLDQQESSMVRREAAFILQNLLVMPMPANAEEAKDSNWQHPCVHDEVSGVSLVGLPALQALLYHCQYFQHVALAASSCYRGRYTFHLQPRAGTSSDTGLEENDSLDSQDSLWFWRCDPPAPTINSSRPSSSLSTSSTVIRGSRPHTPKAPSPLSISEDTPASRLMAQGQSDTDTSDSVTSQDSQQGEPSAIEPVVMVTPNLLTAHCGLLTNLLAVLPDFTLTAIRHNQLLQVLASLVDIGPIEKCLTELKTPSVLPGEREDIKSQVITLLQFLSSFSKLLQSCVTVSQELIPELDFPKQLLTALVSVLMLDTKGLDAGTRDTVCMCWADVFMLLATLVRRDSSAAYPSVSAALGRRWRAFAGTLSVCVTEKFADPLLHTVALQFLCTVCTEETKSRGVGATTSKCATTLADIVNGPSASQLCELLLQSFEKRTLQDPLKKLTGRALMTLLACSPTAQNHAAKAGLIDSCVEQMKQTHSQLHLESVRPSKASHRKKEEGYLKEIKLTVEILRSALYRNDECKVVATDARLTLALYALWPWLLLDDPTMEAVLELLCVYTANCTAACSSLCGTGPGIPPGSKGTSSSSLMHAVMKLASGIAPDNSPIQKLAFSLLVNLAMSRDCRGLLQKNNFLQGFLSVPVPKAGGVKATSAGGGVSLLGLWLRLLVSLSFAEDTQQSILRVSGALELLADLAPHRRPALLTLHNLCFCPANKPHVIANDKAMKVLLSCLESKEMETRCMGASALWALLHNNQRAKTTLKCPSVRLRIEKAHTISKKDAENKQEPTSTYLLKCLENLSQLLNN